jgi:hypothetical protein
MSRQSLSKAMEKTARRKMINQQSRIQQSAMAMQVP